MSLDDVRETARKLQERHERNGSPSLHALTRNCFSHPVRREAVAFLRACLENVDELADGLSP